jgi:Cof subfamily protein (haloacid dehalogenase superfamily)
VYARVRLRIFDRCMLGAFINKNYTTVPLGLDARHNKISLAFVSALLCSSFCLASVVHESCNTCVVDFDLNCSSCLFATTMISACFFLILRACWMLMLTSTTAAGYLFPNPTNAWRQTSQERSAALVSFSVFDSSPQYPRHTRSRLRNNIFQKRPSVQAPKATANSEINVNHDPAETKWWDSRAWKDNVRSIKAVASDIDGTLLCAKTQTMHPRTLEAVRAAIQSEELHFFVATGKSRQGALNSLGDEMKSLIQDNNVPGVYLQGLYCGDGNNRNVLFERRLTRQAVEMAQKLAQDSGISIVGYDGDALYTIEMTPMVHYLSDHYGEPLPRLLQQDNKESNMKELVDVASTVGAPLSAYKKGLHKVMLMDENIDKLTHQIRPMLEELAGQCGARVTQSRPTMLELIPEGCSKAKGVEALCLSLGIGHPASQLMALGDAENDVEMLQLAALGVAMGNGTPPARDAADITIDLKCNEGGVGLVLERLLADSA